MRICRSIATHRPPARNWPNTLPQSRGTRPGLSTGW
ncbi:EspF repeat-containing protein [Puniceibacterium sp. IMCC21224]